MLSKKKPLRIVYSNYNSEKAVFVYWKTWVENMVEWKLRFIEDFVVFKIFSLKFYSVYYNIVKVKFWLKKKANSKSIRQA